MTLTVQEFVADAVERAAQTLIAAARAAPAGTDCWAPLDRGRTILDQVAECAAFNGFIVLPLRERAWTESLGAQWQAQWEEARARLDTLEKAAAELRENTAALAAALRALPEEHLSGTVTLPWGEQRSFAQCLLMPYWNMTYHEGQINYIQTLCA